MRLGYISTLITPHTLHICAGYKTNKRDCLKQACLFVFFCVCEGPGEGSVQCYAAMVLLRHKKESNSVDKRDY